MKVVFVVGPTAAGKSAIALSLAEKFNGAIFNCDSIQLYKGVDVGSAKPTEEERQRAPHYLFDQAEFPTVMTAGEYARSFFSQVQDLENRFQVIFVVGGTGFYFQAIEKGMYPIGIADQAMKTRVLMEIAEVGGPERLHKELSLVDPQAAAKIFINDHYRLGRAIEIIRSFGKSLTEVRADFAKQQNPFPYPLLKIGVSLPKEIMLGRVQARIEKMFSDGWLNEVKSLLAKTAVDWAPLESVGYKEIVEYLNSQSQDLQALKFLIAQNTMKLAKKQRTWFQRDETINWLVADSIGQRELAAEALVQQFLGKK